jgi:hypothetical protein
MKFAVVLALCLGVLALSVDCTTASRSLLFGTPPLPPGLGETPDLTSLIATMERWNSECDCSFPTTADALLSETWLSVIFCQKQPRCLTGIALACVAFAVC